MDSAPRPHYQVTFGILAVSIGAFALLQSLVIPVLSTIQAELHTSQSAVTWVLTAYLLSASVMTPILGRGGDIYDIHLAGLRTPGPVSATPSMSAGQLAELLPRP